MERRTIYANSQEVTTELRPGDVINSATCNMLGKSRGNSKCKGSMWRHIVCSRHGREFGVVGME